MQDVIQNRCWWFGINNVKKRTPTSKYHVIYPDIAPLLNGLRQEFEWPYHKPSKRFYELMRPGDKVLFWMGDGSYSDWGILGFGFISVVKHSAEPIANRYILKADYVPSVPLSPYPSKQPQETETVKFLRRTFGVGFRPLGKTFKNVGYEKYKWAIITIDEVTSEQYEAVLAYTREHSREPAIGYLASSSKERDNQNSDKEIILPEEVEESVQEVCEGAVRRITVNAYERSTAARQACIAHYGAFCSICDFDFAKVYGEIGEGYIHVHHLKELSEIGEAYKVDPVRDLRPVCPNCHTMLHKRKPAYTIEELKELLHNRAKSKI